MHAISTIQNYFEVELPQAYIEFLNKHEVELGGDANVYLPQDVIERNQTYETLEYTPGYIAIGDDGSGRAFILKLTEKDPAVFLVDHGSMDADEKEFVCISFSKWVGSNFEF